MGSALGTPGFAISDLGYDSNVFAVTDDSPVPKVGDYFIAAHRDWGLVLSVIGRFSHSMRACSLRYAQQSDLAYFNVFAMRVTVRSGASACTVTLASSHPRPPV